MTRTPFNDGWRYEHTGAGDWTDITLPHDAMIHETRTPNTPNGSHTGWFPGGHYTYARTWTPPADLVGSMASLVFEGVYHRSTVSIDGEQVGGCLTGYTEFEVPFADVLEERPYAITVAVDNADGPNSRWYSGSGIYRPVHLRTHGPVAFTRDGVRVVLGDEGGVRVDVELVNPDHTETTVDVTLGAASGTVRTDSTRVSMTLDVPDLRRWSVQDPHLYDLVATVSTDGKASDTWAQQVGLRTVRTIPGEGLYVNDTQVLLRGACIHHDNGVIGATTLAAAERRRVRILKEQGYNAIRMSHHPASRALLEACDELGVFVMDELTDTWFRSKTEHDLTSHFDQTWRIDVDAMVAKDRNHASVIMYSTGNEIGESGTPEGIRSAHAIADRIRGLDGTRLVTAGVNAMLNSIATKGRSVFNPEQNAKREKVAKSEGNAITSTGYNLLVSKIGRFMAAATKRRSVGRAVAGIADSLDVLGYNYAAPRYAIDAKEHPGRILVGAETMTFDIAENWALVEKLPNLIGDFVWVGWDYLGEVSLGAWNYEGQTGFSKPHPFVLAGSGALDITGHPTAPMLLARAVWGVADGPEIAVRPVSPTGRLIKAPWRGSNGIPGWAWAGCEGRRATVEVFSDAPSVELLLDGVSLGTRKAGRKHGYTATFTVPWAPGELVAVARDASGREVGRTTARSAAGPLGLRLSADRTELDADGQDAATVVIELVDAAGTVELAHDVDVTVTVDGPAVLQGLGSANFAAPDPFDDDRTRTWFGRALAVVRTTDEPGDVTVTVHADGYPDASLTLAIR